MEILLNLQNIRTELLDKIMLFVTEFGAEIIAVAVICLLYWCINKKFAYKLGFIYFLSGILCQILKIVFVIPRPWIRYKSYGLSAVEAAKEGASGYSFPSGHVQNAAALWGTLAYYAKKIWIQIIFFVILIGVIFSRMYLGVHTPADVCIAFLLTIAIVMLVTYLVDSKKIYNMTQTLLAAILLIIPLFMVGLGIVFIVSGRVEADNVSDYFKAAGAAFAFIFGWLIETNYINFDEKRGTVITKAIRFVTGVAITLLLRYVIKSIFGTSLLVDFIRYAVIVFWIICIYPFILNKIAAKKDNKTLEDNNTEEMEEKDGI